MTLDVLCLRPEADFQRVGVKPPASLSIAYRLPDDPQLAAFVREARALVIPAVGPKLAGSLFEGGNVRLVQVTGAGVDRLDEASLKRLGVAVANVPGGSNSAVAEYAVACALVMLRRFAWADAEIRAGNYVSCRGRLLVENLPGLEGLTAGVVGMGVIGLAVAQGFHRFGCRIVYHDPGPRDAAAAAALGAQALALEELLSASDIVTLHVPLTPRTRNLIGAKQFALMKPGAVLINAARGGVVNETALAAHLHSGRLGGAAVDVYSSEPAETDNPLFALEGEAARRVLFTPHVAGVTRQSFATLFREAWENVERVLVRGEAPLHRIY
jgi:phosphoglycerate dehydrogenase-like enzyme